MHERPILLTGATGYIGSRLLRELEAGGCMVRCLARQPARVAATRATTEVVIGDCLDTASLDAAMTGVDQAFYLVHSMASGASFAARDREAAANFGRAARRAGVRRIIYLGGLADNTDALSTVLQPLLWIAFAHRHRVVRTAIGNSRQRVAPRWATAVALVAATTLQPAAAPAQTPPVRAVPFVDLDRYTGDWFEIARFPNRFQRQCVGDVRATYARRSDGRVDVVNRCRTAEGETAARGVARIVDERTFAKLKVRFAPSWVSWLPMVWGEYWIIGLAPDYSWAVVGDPGRDYLWILARAPRLDDDSMAAARAVARDNGFDVDRLLPTSQPGAARP